MGSKDSVGLFNALLARDAAATEACLRAPDFALDRFRAFADLHQLSGFLYRHVAGSALQDLLPATYLDYLGERYALQHQRCETVLREAAGILTAFSAAQLPVLFLKGPFLAQQFYGDMRQRFHWDIDILVPREEVVAADRLIRDMGYSRLSLVLLSNGAMTHFTHTYDYHKRIAGQEQPVRRQFLPLDLHWRLRSHFSFRLDYRSIWQQRTDCRLQERMFPVLSAEYALVMNVLGIFVDIELGTIRLKNMLDLYKILATVDPVMDWDAFIERRSAENIAVIVLNVIDLMLDILACRDRFPGVASLLEKQRAAIRLTLAADKYRLLERSRSAVFNRRWAHHLYQAPVIRSFLWTVTSLPFRVAAHDRKFLRLVGRM